VKNVSNTNMLNMVLFWIARIASVIVLAGVMVIFIGEGGFNLLKLTASEGLMITLIWLSCAGLAIGWKWPGLGGLISIGSLLVFYFVELAITGNFPKGYVYRVIALPGIFYLLSFFIIRPGHIRAEK
jgi:hypothetical protein